MSDTVGVALIAVAGTLASGGLSYLSARSRTKVELRSISSEMTRFQTELSESGREARKALYREFLVLLAEFQSHARNLISEADVNEVQIRIHEKMGDVQLLAPYSVSSKMEAVVDVLITFNKERKKIRNENGEKDQIEIDHEAADRVNAAIKQSRTALLTAMREDLGTGPQESA